MSVTATAVSGSHLGRSRRREANELVDQQPPELGVGEPVIGAGEAAAPTQLSDQAFEDHAQFEVVAMIGPRFTLAFVSKAVGLPRQRVAQLVGVEGGDD